jgi:invasion protein IalB
VTVTIGSDKFELFTKDEGAFVEKADIENNLVAALKTGTTMKVDGVSSRGTKTSDSYSLSGVSEALDRMIKECSS